MIADPRSDAAKEYALRLLCGKGWVLFTAFGLLSKSTRFSGYQKCVMFGSKFAATTKQRCLICTRISLFFFCFVFFDILPIQLEPNNVEIIKCHNSSHKKNVKDTGVTQQREIKINIPANQSRPTYSKKPGKLLTALQCQVCKTCPSFLPNNRW